jgi:hypothetical protein
MHSISTTQGKIYLFIKSSFLFWTSHILSGNWLFGLICR